MSFRVVCPLQSCSPSPHFHQSKSKDDQAEVGKTAKHCDLQTLDVQKINHAFHEFSKNSHAIGCLGWGILQQPYAFNASGLTAYLLEKGGIFNLTSFKRDSVIIKVIRTVCSSAIFFGIVNGYSWYQFRRSIQSSDDFESSGDFTQIWRNYTLPHAVNLLAYLESSNIEEICLEQLKKSGYLELLRKSAQIPEKNYTAQNETKTKKIKKWMPLYYIGYLANRLRRLIHLHAPYSKESFEEIKFNPGIIGMWDSEGNCYVTPTPSIMGATRKATRAIAKLSKVSLVTVVVSLALLYAHRRFLQCNFSDPDDLERLVVSAQEGEENQRVRAWNQMYFAQVRSFNWLSIGLALSTLVTLRLAYQKRSSLRKTASSALQILKDM